MDMDMAQDLGMQGQWQCPLEQVRMKPVYCWDMTQTWGPNHEKTIIGFRSSNHPFVVSIWSFAAVYGIGHTELEWIAPFFRSCWESRLIHLHVTGQNQPCSPEWVVPPKKIAGSACFSVICVIYPLVN